MPRFSDRDDRTIKTVFDVWLARDMLFHNPERGFRVYEKYTKCEKVKYDTKILRYLDEMERRVVDWNDGMGRAVAIRMDKKIRYMWRGDLLTEKEYEEIQQRKREGLRMLREKSKRDVGSQSSD